MKSNKLGKSTDIYFSGIIMDDVIWVHGGTIVENGFMIGNLVFLS